MKNKKIEEKHNNKNELNEKGDLKAITYHILEEL